MISSDQNIIKEDADLLLTDCNSPVKNYRFDNMA